MEKFLALQPGWLYRVDLETINQAGRCVVEEFENDNVKAAKWYLIPPHKEIERNEAEEGTLKRIEEAKQKCEFEFIDWSCFRFKCQIVICLLSICFSRS